jgi:hypothetical protein
LGGFLLRYHVGFLGGELELRGFGLGFLKLFGFEDEAGAFVEVNPPRAGRAIGVVLVHRIFEEVTGVGMIVGRGNFEQVAKFQQKRLRVRALRRTGSRPMGNEPGDIPLRQRVVLHDGKRGGILSAAAALRKACGRGFMQTGLDLKLGFARSVVIWKSSARRPV